MSVKRTERVSNLKSAVIRDARAGVSFNALARIHGINVTTVRLLCNEEGVSSTAETGPVVDRERIDTVRNLVLSGLTYTQVAEQIGGSVGAVAGLCSRNGIKAPSKVKRAPRTRPVVVADSDRRRPKASTKPAVRLSTPAAMDIRDPGTAIAFPNLRPGCRWPLWSDDTPVDQLTVCGAALDRGWTCAFHARLAYRAPERRAA